MPSDPRTYITVHDGMPDHPKIEGLSDPAFRLLVTCWCWCSRNLTDGVIQRASWEKRGTSETRLELVLAGLVEPLPDGVSMHDYLEHQRSAEQVAELRAKRVDAGRAGGLASANARASARANAQPNGDQTLKQNGSKVQAESETEVEGTSTEVPAPRKRVASRIPDDFQITDDMREWAASSAQFIDIDRETESFLEYWRSKSGKDATKLDWRLTWQTWMRRSSDRIPPSRRNVTAAGPQVLVGRNGVQQERTW